MKHAIELKVEEWIEVKGRRGITLQQQLDDLKETTGWQELKAEALCGPLWRTRFGRSNGQVVRQTTE